MPLEVSPIYKKWLFLLPWDKGNNLPCPSCDSNAIEYRVIGNQERNLGWALIWCNACGCGIHISRMRLPANAKILSFEEAEAHPDLIRPLIAITFLEP